MTPSNIADIRAEWAGCATETEVLHINFALAWDRTQDFNMAVQCTNHSTTGATRTKGYQMSFVYFCCFGTRRLYWAY